MSRWSKAAKTHLQYLGGLAISLVLLLLAFRGVKWTDLLHALGAVDLRWVGLALVLLGGSLVTRALRWRVLLTPLVCVSAADVFSYTMIGYLANNVLPMRLGEIVRAGLLGEKLRASKSGVLATVIVERALDVLSLLAFVVVLLIVLDIPMIVRASIVLGETAALVVILILSVLARQDKDPERWVPHFVPEQVRIRLIVAIDGFVQGLRVLTGVSQVLAAVAWSSLAWGLFAASVILFLRAAGLSGLPWYASLLVIIVTNLGSAIPSSPGFVGGYHFLAVYSLGFWQVPKSDALSFAILVHGVNYVVVTGLGALMLLRENIAFSSLRQRAQPQQSGDVSN